MAKNKDKQEETIKEETPAPIVDTGPKWVKVTEAQLKKVQDEGKLIGYRPDTQEALIK